MRGRRVAPVAVPASSRTHLGHTKPAIKSVASGVRREPKPAEGGPPAGTAARMQAVAGVEDGRKVPRRSVPFVDRGGAAAHSKVRCGPSALVPRVGAGAGTTVRTDEGACVRALAPVQSQPRAGAMPPRIGRSVGGRKRSREGPAQPEPR